MSKLRMATRRFDNLWKAAEDACDLRDYPRALRVMRIIEAHGDREASCLARDHSRFIREVRAADGKSPNTFGMGSQQLDRMPGPDKTPEELAMEREAEQLNFHRERRRIVEHIAKGDVQTARDRLEWLADRSLASARGWAFKKIAELDRKGQLPRRTR